MTPLTFLTSLLLLTASPVTFAPDSWLDPEDERSIQRTLTYYFYGDEIHDIEVLTKAYHPQAFLTYVDVETGKYEKLHVGDYLSTLAESKSSHVQRKLTVEKMDVTGNAAIVKTQILYPTRGMKISDYLSLHKMEGEWRIVSRTSYKEYATFEREKMPFWKRSVHEQHQKINSVLATYLKGREESDSKALETAFLPNAAFTYIDPRKGTYHNVEFDAYLQMTKTPGDVFPKRHYEVKAIDITGNIAVAKIKIRYKRYKASVTDYVSLVKSAGKWRIIHKASDKEKKALLAPV